MEIRKATAEDVGAMVRLWRGLVNSHLPYHSSYATHANSDVTMKKHLSMAVKSSDYGVFVAVEDDVVVGYALLSIQSLPPVFEQKFEARLSDLFVASRFRNQGVGRKLLEKTEQWAKAERVHQFTLEVDKLNPNAASLYQKFGFKPYRIKMIKQI